MPLNLTPKDPPKSLNPAIDAVEAKLRESIYQKCKGSGSEERTLRQAFSWFDTDNSGEISMHEFERALERFGTSGVPPEVLQALFDRYNSDNSDALSYGEFASGLFGGRASSSTRCRQNGADALLNTFDTALLTIDAADKQPLQSTTNPWLPSLQAAESMDPFYVRPNPAHPARRVRSIAWR